MSWIDDLPTEIVDTLPDEIKTNPTLNKYNSLDEALKGHIHTATLVGNSIRTPGPDASETEKQDYWQKIIDKDSKVMLKPDFSDPTQSEEFYQTLGKPDDFSKYENPEGANLDSEVEVQIREMAFKRDFTNSQYQGIVSDLSSMNDQTVENNQLVHEQAMKGLTNKWGATTDSRMQAAKKMMEEFGTYPGRSFESLNPAEIESLYSFHTSVTGSGPQAPGQPSPPAGMTPYEAEEQAAEIMRRVHDPKSELDHGEKMRLINKTIELKRKYIPKFAEEA